MQVRSLVNWQLCQGRFAKLVAGGGDTEATPFEVANGHAGSVCVDKVSDLAATIGEDGRLVFSIEQLAVTDEETSSDSVAEWLRLEILQVVEGEGVDVG